MKRLMCVLIAGLCLFGGAMPLFAESVPLVLITNVNGNVTAVTAAASWTPLLGETLSVGTKLNLPAETDTLDLVHIKLQKEISLKGPKTDVTIMDDGLAGITAAEWGNSMGGIPTDLAMGSDALNQVGAIRDHSTAVVALQNLNRGIKSSLVPQTSEPVVAPSVAPSPDAENKAMLLMEKARMEQEQAQKENAKAGNESRDPIGGARPEGRLPASDVTMQESPADNFDGTNGAGSHASEVAGAAPADEGTGNLPAPAPAPAPSTQMPDKSLSLGVQGLALETSVDFLVALPESLYSRLLASDTFLTVQISGKNKDLAWRESPLKGWRLLSVPGEELGKLKSISLLRNDKSAVRVVYIQKPDSETVLGALKLETEHCPEMAAAIWIDLFRAGKVLDKVLNAHLERLKSKILKPQVRK